MDRKEFQRLAASRVLLLDGAAGSNFLLAGMPADACTEQWLIEHPDVLIKLQREYVKAGTQILYAPTFGGNRTMLQEKHANLSVQEINSRIVALSKEAAQRRAMIAGDMTMTGKQLMPNGIFSIHEAVAVYKEQAKALYEAGVDLFVVETMISLQEMRAAVLAIREVCDLPIMCTFTVDANGFTFLGTEITAAAVTLERMGVDAIGMNCSMGPDQMELAVRKIREAVQIPVIAKANAGHPEQENGHTVYKMSAEIYAKHAEKLLDAGVGLIGGCCGTTPAFIHEICELLKQRGQYVPLGESGVVAKTASMEANHRYQGCLTSARSIFDTEEAAEISYAGCVAKNNELRRCLEEKEYDELMDVLEDAEDSDLLFVDIDMAGVDVIPAIEPMMGVISGMDIPVCVRTEKEDILREVLLCYCGSLSVCRTPLTMREDICELLSRYGAVLAD